MARPQPVAHKTPCQSSCLGSVHGVPGKLEGPAQEWHRNGRANEIHLGTVLPSGFNWHLRRYDVQEWRMNF